MNEPQKNRTVKPNGDAISRLRKAKGWRVEDLALKAECSPRSVENAERGKNVYLNTLGRFAAALGVEYVMLVPGGEAQEVVKQVPNIVLSGNDKEAASLLVELLVKMLPTTGEIIIRFVKEGSVIVALEMNETDALLLVSLFPDFHEHAREFIAETPEGKAYFSGVNPDGFDVSKVRKLLELVDTVRELRFTAGPDSPPPDSPGELPPPPKPITKLTITGTDFTEIIELDELDVSKGSSGKTGEAIKIDKPRKRSRKSPYE